MSVSSLLPSYSDPIVWQEIKYLNFSAYDIADRINSAHH